MYFVYFAIAAVALILVAIAGVTPLLLVPVGLVIAVALAWPVVFGAARRMGTPPPGGPRSHRPSTREASHDPAAGPPR